jgi:hypothetical protein
MKCSKNKSIVYATPVPSKFIVNNMFNLANRFPNQDILCSLSLSGRITITASLTADVVTYGRYDVSCLPITQSSHLICNCLHCPSSGLIHCPSTPLQTISTGCRGMRRWHMMHVSLYGNIGSFTVFQIRYRRYWQGVVACADDIWSTFPFMEILFTNYHTLLEATCILRPKERAHVF